MSERIVRKIVGIMGDPEGEPQLGILEQRNGGYNLVRQRSDIDIVTNYNEEPTYQQSFPSMRESLIPDVPLVEFKVTTKQGNKLWCIWQRIVYGQNGK